MDDVSLIPRQMDEQAKAEALHHLRNSPWGENGGIYKHLVFPPYTYTPYPKALYREPALGTLETALVRSAAEHRALGGDWAETPALAREARLSLEAAVAEAAANRAYTDRHLSEPAARELAAIDDAHEGHLVEVPEAPKRGRK